MSTPKDIEDDCKFYQEGYLQSSSKAASATKSELAMKIRELACKTAQLEVLMKQNTNTLIEGFNQPFTLMNEFLQDHSEHLYYFELDEAK